MAVGDRDRITCRGEFGGCGETSDAAANDQDVDVFQMVG
jgi:hypothetical protein